MKYFELVKDKLSSLWPMWLVTMLVATWSTYIQDGQINRDGLLYLKQAYLIAEGSWKEGLALYPWPFFSILVAVFHKLTNFHLQIVAHGMDLVLFGIATLFYLKTLQLIYKKEKQIIFYGGVILLSFIPIMDDYVGMVLRDHGIWAGCMMGTYFYFKNVNDYSFRSSVSWQSGFFFSGLFRPEGFVFLIVLPLWNLFKDKPQSIKKILFDYLLIFILSIMCLFIVMLSNINFLDILNSSRLLEFSTRPLQFIEQLITPLPISTSNTHLIVLLNDYSLIIMYAVLISILVFKWMKGLGLLHGGLIIYSFLKRPIPKNTHIKTLYMMLILSFILVSVNLFNVYVLTNRYWGFHWWWIFILCAPIMLGIFKNKSINLTLKFCVSILSIFLIICSLIDNSKNLEMEIALFIKNNNFSDIDFNDNHRINYYITRDIKDLLNQNKTNNRYKYSVIKREKEIDLKNTVIIKNFPDNKPKFSIIEYVK